MQINRRLWVGRAINKQCPRLNSGGSWRGHLLSTTSKWPLRQVPRCYYNHLKSNNDHGLHHTHCLPAVQLAPPFYEKAIPTSGIHPGFHPTSPPTTNRWDSNYSTLAYMTAPAPADTSADTTATIR